jgi:hypothetical protein
VHDDIGMRGIDRRMNSPVVERISDNGPGTKFPQESRLGGRPREAGHAMTATNQSGNQTASDRTGRAGDKYTHGVTPGC